MYQQPTLVEITRHDGTQEQLVFATRLEAEAYVALIPALQAVGEREATGIASAIIAPMAVGVN